MATESFLLGTPSRFERIPKFTPQNIGALNQLVSMGLGGLQQTQPDFAPIEKREVQRFKQETLPAIAERFTGLGAQRSSGFREAYTGGAQDLSTNLAALRGQFDLQNRGQLMQMLGMGLTPQDEIGYFAGRPGALGIAGAGLAQGAGMALPLLLSSLFGKKDDGDAGAAGPDILKLIFSLLRRGKPQPQNQSIQYNTIPQQNIA